MFYYFSKNLESAKISLQFNIFMNIPEFLWENLFIYSFVNEVQYL